MTYISVHRESIRGDKNDWNWVEMSIEQHAETTFSHGICKNCSDELYGDEEWYQKINPERSNDSS